MPKKPHPADAAVDFSTATSFIVSLFLGRGKYVKNEVATIDAANEVAAKMNAESTNGRLAMIYGRFADGSEKLVGPIAFAPAKKKPAKSPMAKAKTARAGRKARAKAMDAAADAETAKPARKAKAAPAAKPAPANGIPTPPDFSAKTHAPYRGRLEAVIALVEAKDIAGLKAFQIAPYSSSPRAIARYRDRAIAALEA
jgi:hypothetical protein